MLTRSLSCGALAFACVSLASAALADPTGGAVPAAPFVGAIGGYVAAVIGAAIPVLLGLLLSQVKALTGLSISADLQAQVAAWATMEAQALAANVEGNLGSRSFTVGSPEVAAILNAAPAEILKILTDLGWSTDDLAKRVVAAIGKLQQSAPTVVAPK